MTQVIDGACGMGHFSVSRSFSVGARIAPNRYRTVQIVENPRADRLKCMAIGNFISGRTRCLPTPKEGRFRLF